MDDRFEDTDLVVEWVEKYRRGGFHPVHLHDVFNQRYEVIAKLAYGSSATVWLAKDHLWVFDILPFPLNGSLLTSSKTSTTGRAKNKESRRLQR